MLPPHPRPIILVVGDEPHVCIILQRILRDLAPNHTIITALTADHALIPLHAGVVQMLICDSRLPGLDGLELARRTKIIAPATCIVLLTTASSRTLDRHAYAIGVDAVLVKPFRLDRLEEMVQRLLA